ncbi:MAG: outer membrane lipoprotein-sorting protein [Armatimonadetes bacterium]|nr:outer membrane lipoprotein-sorting protein [Armatimonadota bacterium]MBS1711696.1 outer membrane lipoprotein-sorting protein [Armatimonadota bacterium]MBX3109749.1 outer membrane lipoprotein-sorting protein [Fimbriimonadaceae bacterium]
MSLTATFLATTLLGQSNSISSYWQSGLKDATFTARVGKASQRELQKINKDFAQSYRFDYTDVKMKEPFMLRLESKVDDQSIWYIINGPNRLLSIPKSGIRNRENLSKSPGKRQTIFDFGLIAPSLFDGFMQAAFIRVDRATNEPVFDVTYESRLGDDSRHRIWVDPSKHYVTKREWYSQNGSKPLLAVFKYKNPKQVSGVWVPTVLEVYNSQNTLAGTTYYENISVNTGLSSSLFATN